MLGCGRIQKFIFLFHLAILFGVHAKDIPQATSQLALNWVTEVDFKVSVLPQASTIEILDLCQFSVQKGYAKSTVNKRIIELIEEYDYKFSRLTTLILSDLHMQDDVLSLANLRLLRFELRKSTVPSFKFLESMQTLTVLSLAFTNLNDESMIYLENLPLKSLDLSGTLITGDGLLYLKKCGDLLRSLGLRRCINIRYQALAGLLWFKKLNYLTISILSATLPNIFDYLGRLESLEHLCLYDHFICDLKDINQLAKLKNLKQLHLCHFWGVTKGWLENSIFFKQLEVFGIYCALDFPYAELEKISLKNGLYFYNQKNLFICATPNTLYKSFVFTRQENLYD